MHPPSFPLHSTHPTAEFHELDATLSDKALDTAPLDRVRDIREIFQVQEYAGSSWPNFRTAQEGSFRGNSVRLS